MSLLTAKGIYASSDLLPYACAPEYPRLKVACDFRPSYKAITVPGMPAHPMKMCYSRISFLAQGFSDEQGQDLRDAPTLRTGAEAA